MHIALNIYVQVKDGTLVLTDSAGKTVTFSKAQTVQKKVSMITFGELCGFPQHQLAAGFGFQSRTSYYDLRNAVLQGAPADLLPKRTGPHTPSKRTKEVEILDGACQPRPRVITRHDIEHDVTALLTRGLTSTSAGGFFFIPHLLQLGAADLVAS